MASNGKPSARKQRLSRGKPQRVRQREQFLAQIGQQFRDDDCVDPEQVTRAVFTVLARRVSEGEIEDVKQILPAEIRDLWCS